MPVMLMSTSYPRARVLLFSLTLLLVAACSRHRDEVTPGGATPQAAVADGYRLLRKNDIDGLYRHALPPADYAAMRAQWGEGRDLDAYTPAQRAQFDQMMAALTAPGAQQVLWLKVKPKLATLQQQYRQQMPALVGMLRTMADTGIERSPHLSAGEKVQALKTIAVLGAWAERTNWFEPNRVYELLGLMTGTAQKMSFRTLNQALSMPYSESVRNIDAAWAGFKQALAIYGFSIDAVLQSAHIQVLSNDGSVAVVRTTFDVLGTSVIRDNTLIRQHGRWYDRATLLHWQRVLATPAGASSAMKPSGAASAKGAPLQSAGRAPHAPPASAATGGKLQQVP